MLFVIFHVLTLTWNKPASRSQGCGIRYYRWTGRKLVLLKETPIQKNAA